MNKIKILKEVLILTLVVILQLAICNLQFSFAAFEDLGCGARPLGMGNAFCGIANDANAFLYNPAGLAQLEKLQVSTMYANLYPSLSDGSSITNNFIAVAYPLPAITNSAAKEGWGTVGFGWFNLGVNSDPRRSNATYKEDTYIFSYAKTLEMFSLGVSVKFHTKEYGQNYWTTLNSVFSKTRNAFGVGIDFGLLYKAPDEKLTLGLQLSDVNQPNIQLSEISPVPITVRIGVGYKIKSALDGKFEDIVSALDFTYRDKDYKAFAGIEGWLMEKSIGLRFGFGAGNNSFANISVGASYQLNEGMYNNDFRLDYAFVYPLSGLQPTGGTHRISLTMGFGGK